MEVKIYTIQYREEVLHDDLPSLSQDVKKIIQKQIEKKLISHPEIFGKPLRNCLFGFWALRVDAYRIIYKISSPNSVIIAVISHRSKAYLIAEKRI